MKRLTIFTVLLLFLLSSCSFTVNNNREKWSSSEVAKIPRELIKESIGRDSVSYRVSPDGKWIVTLNSVNEKTEVEISSISDPNINYISGRFDGGVFFDSWSPDSSMILVNQTIVPGHCNIKNLILLSVPSKDSGLLKSKIIPLSTDDEYYSCYVLAWSPDSEKIAFSTVGKSIYYFDVKTDVLTKTTISFDLDNFGSIDWTRNGILATSYFRLDNDSAEFNHNLIWVDSNDSGKFEVLYSDKQYQEVIGSNSSLSEILLIKSQHSNDGSDRSFCLLKYFTDAKTTEEVACETGLIRKYISSSNSEYTAFMYSLDYKGTHASYLWIYDWKTGEIDKLQEVSGILGWSEKDGGFLVVDKDEAGDYSIVLIKHSSWH